MRSPEAAIKGRAPTTASAIQTLFLLINSAHAGYPMMQAVAAIVSRHGLSRLNVRRLVRRLVAEGIIEYRYHCGQPCLAYSFRGSLRASRRFVILPPGVTLSSDPETFPLVIEAGAAFGDGRHPTTRLALLGLEDLFDGLWPGGKPQSGACLDIGTGSGILAIAAARLGAARVVGLDLDPCAVDAARHNVARNGVASRCVVVQQALDSLEEDFDVVLANLRPPTLVRMAARVGKHLRNGGTVILSGFRAEEMAPVTAVYADYGFNLCWQVENAGWGAVGMQAWPA